MLINSLHLINFRQYKDFKIDFPKKNGVTVIRANNSIGKTTLMQSVKWVLFGNNSLQLDNPRDILNYEVAQQYKLDYMPEAEYSVELCVVHNKIEYTLKRSHIVDVVSKRINEENVEISFKENGETKIIRNSDQDRARNIIKTIDSWITEKMINYFFLDGERIEKLSQFDNKSQEEISEAITSVSKLPIIKNALESTKEVLKNVKRQEALATNNREVIQITDEIEKVKEKIERSQNEKKSLHVEFSINHDDLKEIDRELSNIEQVASLQVERHSLDKEFDETQERIKKVKSEIQGLYREYKHKQLVYMLFQKYNVENLRGNEAKKTIPHMEVEAINSIIKNGVCICGTTLENEHLTALEEQKKYQPPVSNEGLLISYEHSVELEIIELDKKVDEINLNIQLYFKEDTKKHNIIDRLNEINSKISMFNESDIKDLNNSRQTLIRNQEIKKIKMSELDSDIKASILHLEKLETKKRKKLLELEQSKLVQTKLYLIKEVNSQLSNLNKNEIEKQRNSIEKYANIHFSDIISKKKKVIIDEDYKHIVKDDNGNKTSLSSGESIALSISIILAIIDTHKENLKRNNKEELLSDKDYFLFLDGAFAVLDQNFSKAIATKISERVNQVILLTNDNQYTNSVKEAFSKKLEKEYILIGSNSEKGNSLTTSNLKEVNINEK